MTNNRRLVEDCISNIENRFKENPHIFLTEEDVRGHLFCELLNKFGEEEKTKDGSISIATHSNISWYDEDGSLSLRPDIAIIEVGTLDMTKETSKGFVVEKIPFGVEIKLNRGEKGKDSVLYDLREDLDKLERLRRTNDEVIFYMLYLDKASRLTAEDIDLLQTNHNSKIIYVPLNSSTVEPSTAKI